MSDPLSEELWRQHEEWLERHAEAERRRFVVRERWTAEEWRQARGLAEERWDGEDFYLYAAIRALEAVQWGRLLDPSRHA